MGYCIYTIFAYGVDEIATNIRHNRSVVAEFLEVHWEDVQGLTGLIAC